MSIYHKIYHNTTEEIESILTTTTTYMNTTTLIPGNNYDEKLVFRGEEKVTIDALTDLVIVFLLLSIAANYVFIFVALTCSKKCKKDKKDYNIETRRYIDILNTIFIENDMNSLTPVDISYILNKYGYRNRDINGAKLQYIFKLEDYNDVYDEIKDNIIDEYNDNIDKYKFMQDYFNMKDEFHPHSNEDLYEINKRKLEAEISIGVLSAIIMGFSISIYKIENYKNYYDTLFNILNYVHVFIKSVVSGLSMLNVISSTTIYFQGMMIISRRHINNKKMLEDFDKWWNNIKKLRTLIRYCFIYCLPLFLISFVTNPDIWINNIFLAIFNLVIIYGSVIFGTIAYYKFNFI